MANINLQELVDSTILQYFKGKQDSANDEKYVQETLLETTLEGKGYKTESELGSTYATKASVETKADRSELTDLATKSEVNAKADATELEKKIDTTTADGKYATKTELNAKANTTDLDAKLDSQTASDTYATKTELSSKADATALEGKADKSELTAKLDVTTASETYATKSELGNKLDSTTASETYATKSEIPKDYLTADSLAGLATESKVDEKINQAHISVIELGENVDTLENLQKITPSKKEIRWVEDQGIFYLYTGSKWEAIDIPLDGLVKTSEVKVVDTTVIDGWFE